MNMKEIITQDCLNGVEIIEVPIGINSEKHTYLGKFSDDLKSKLYYEVLKGKIGIVEDSALPLLRNASTKDFMIRLEYPIDTPLRYLCNDINALGGAFSNLVFIDRDDSEIDGFINKKIILFFYLKRKLNKFKF